MYYPIVLRIALRYIYSKSTAKFNQCIYWFSNISITLSISIIIIILTVMNGFERELKNNILYFTPHLTITAVKGYTDLKDIPHCISRSLSNNLMYIKPLIMSKVILQSYKKISIGTILGIDPNHFEPLLNCLIKNEANSLMSGKYCIIISSALAQQLSVNINDQIRVIVPSVSMVTPIGYFPSQRLFTVSDIYMSNNSTMDIYQVLMHRDDAKNLMHYPEDCITGWRIWLYNPFKINKLFELKIMKDWIWKDWCEYIGPVFQAIKIEKIVMFLLFALVILISGFNIVAFLILSITERRKEVAILKTYGFSRFQIVMIFLIQGMSNGVFGIIWGTGIGIFLSKKLNQILLYCNILPNKFQLPIEIQYVQIFSIDLIVYILIIFTMLYPSWRISCICPSRVLNYD